MQDPRTEVLGCGSTCSHPRVRVHHASEIPNGGLAVQKEPGQRDPLKVFEQNNTLTDFFIQKCGGQAGGQ